MTTDNAPQGYVFSGNAMMDQFMARRTAEVEGAFLLPYLRSGLSLVDMGCGQGTITAGLAEAVAPGRVLGFDLQAEHLDRARALAGDRGLANVEYKVADMYEPPCEPESFDVAFAFGVYSYLGDPGKGLCSAYRILKPGGLLATSDRGGEVLSTGVLAGQLKRCRAIIQDVQDAFSGNPYGARLGLEMNRLCRESGFEVLSVSGKLEVTPVADMAAALPNFLFGPMADRAVQAGATRQEEIEDLAAQILAGCQRDWDGYVATPRFQVIARKPL